MDFKDQGVIYAMCMWLLTTPDPSEVPCWKIHFLSGAVTPGDMAAYCHGLMIGIPVIMEVKDTPCTIPLPECENIFGTPGTEIDENTNMSTPKVWVLSPGWICSSCLRTSTTMKKCSACLLERYCCSECQQQHWRTSHKHECAIHKARFQHVKQMRKLEKHVMFFNIVPQYYFNLWRMAAVKWHKSQGHDIIESISISHQINLTPRHKVPHLKL